MSLKYAQCEVRATGTKNLAAGSEIVQLLHESYGSQRTNGQFGRALEIAGKVWRQLRFILEDAGITDLTQLQGRTTPLEAEAAT